MRKKETKKYADDSVKQTKIYVEALENLRSALFIFDVPKNIFLKSTKSDEFYYSLIHDFENEMKQNITFLSGKEESDKLIDAYLVTIEDTLKFIEKQYSNGVDSYKYRFVESAEDLSFLKKLKYFASDAIDRIGQIKVNQLFILTEKARDLNLKIEKSLTLPERLIVLRCLQEEGLFIKENQTTSKKDIIVFLMYILATDKESIKSAYKKSSEYLESKKLTIDQKRYAISSLKKVSGVLNHVNCEKIITRLEARIKTLELSS